MHGLLGPFDYKKNLDPATELLLSKGHTAHLLGPHYPRIMQGELRGTYLQLSHSGTR